MNVLLGKEDNIVTTTFKEGKKEKVKIESKNNRMTDIFFGGNKESKLNITALILLILTVTLCAYSLFYGDVPNDLFITVYMTVIGYFLGKK